MYRHLLSISAFLLAAGLSPLLAETVTVTMHSIPEKLRVANPQLAAARLRIAEAHGRLKGAGRLSNPALEIGAKHDKDVRERGFEIGFSQAFPLTDRLRLEKEVSAAELRVAEAEVAEVERRLVAKARAAVVEVLAARDLKVMRGEESKLAAELAAFIERAVAKGEGSALDAGQARLGAVQHALAIRQLDVRAAAAMGELKGLLGIGAAGVLEVKGELPVPLLPSSNPVAVEARPDYRAAVLATEVAAKELELEKSKRREDIEAGVFFESDRAEDAPHGLETDRMIGFRISIPLPLWNKNEGAIEEKAAKRKRSAKEAEALAGGIRNEAATARSLMAAHAKIVAQIDADLLPLATKQVELSEQSYREGQGDLLAVLRAKDQKIELQTARLDALREFHLARAAFDAAAGK